MVVIWSEEATADLQDIFDGISDESAQNALLVDERICEQTDSLAQFPSTGFASW
jgi:plasmid stabilization system protein ParE